VAEYLDLAGERIRLRSTIPEDARALVAIRSTDIVRSRWRGDDLVTEFAEDLEDEELWQLTIEAGDTIVGLIQFSEEQDPDYRHASLDIYLDPAVHRRGYATDAIRTLATYLFDERDHHRLTIDPAADNHPAIRCYAAVGFRPVGVMRGYERRLDGSWADGLLMEMLASDRAEADPLGADDPAELELQLLSPTVRRDADGLAALLHEDFVEIGASGRRWSRDETIATLVASPDPGSLQVEDLRSRAVADGVVLVSYRMIGPGRAALRSSLWTADGGRWRIRYHQGTPTASDTAPEL
jgi:aminoglycoside 6'-N-acetyltransferase